MKLKFILIILLLSEILLAKKDILIIAPKSIYDSTHKYFYSILEKALSNEKDNINILFSKKMEQGRALIELKNNRGIDVYWAGTSIERENELRAIKIPLVKGLLGYRVFIINKNKKEIFDKITTIEQLKELEACQGEYWPDTKILENSHFNVLKNINYEAMFLQVNSNRCDYFPRGINEGYSEIEARKSSYPNIMLYDNIIIYYPFPVYFFVSKKNEELALKIENGLLRMIEDGSFDKHMQENVTTKHLFPLSKWQNSKIFKIENPFLSKETNINDSKFWLLPENLNK